MFFGPNNLAFQIMPANSMMYIYIYRLQYSLRGFIDWINYVRCFARLLYTSLPCLNHPSMLHNPLHFYDCVWLLLLDTDKSLRLFLWWHWVYLIREVPSRIYLNGSFVGFYMITLQERGFILNILTTWYYSIYQLVEKELPCRKNG